MNNTILLVDDEKEILDLMELYLKKEGYSIIFARDGKKALDKSSKYKIDLAIIDIMMPELDGYQLIKELRKNTDIPIIVVSAKIQSYEKILGLDIGADDYMTKPFDPLELVARAKAQLRRYFGSKSFGDSAYDILSVGQLHLNMKSCTMSFEQEEITLTAIEYNMMKLFMENPRRVLTKQQIYEAVWKENAVVDDNTIMVAISKLRGKIPKEQTTFIRTIRGLGYRLEVGDE